MFNGYLCGVYLKSSGMRKGNDREEDDGVISA